MRVWTRCCKDKNPEILKTKKKELCMLTAWFMLQLEYGCNMEHGQKGLRYGLIGNVEKISGTSKSKLIVTFTTAFFL